LGKKCTGTSFRDRLRRWLGRTESSAEGGARKKRRLGGKGIKSGRKRKKEGGKLSAYPTQGPRKAPSGKIKSEKSSKLVRGTPEVIREGPFLRKIESKELEKP